MVAVNQVALHGACGQVEYMEPVDLLALAQDDEGSTDASGAAPGPAALAR